MAAPHGIPAGHPHAGHGGRLVRLVRGEQRLVPLQRAARLPRVQARARQPAPGGARGRRVGQSAHEREHDHLQHERRAPRLDGALLRQPHDNGRGRPGGDGGQRAGAAAHGGQRRALLVRHGQRRLHSPRVRHGDRRVGHRAARGDRQRLHARRRAAHRALRRHADSPAHVERRRLHTVRVRGPRGGRRARLRPVPGPRAQGRHLPHPHAAVRHPHAQAGDGRGHQRRHGHALHPPAFRAGAPRRVEPLLRLLRDGRERVLQRRGGHEGGRRGRHLPARPHSRGPPAHVRGQDPHRVQDRQGAGRQPHEDLLRFRRGRRHHLQHEPRRRGVGQDSDRSERPQGRRERQRHQHGPAPAVGGVRLRQRLLLLGVAHGPEDRQGGGGRQLAADAIHPPARERPAQVHRAPRERHGRRVPQHQGRGRALRRRHRGLRRLHHQRHAERARDGHERGRRGHHGPVGVPPPLLRRDQQRGQGQRARAAGRRVRHAGRRVA